MGGIDFSSNVWTQLNPSNPPSPRYGHTAIYVPSSNSMPIFGGFIGTGDLNDLWSYNISSNSWIQVSSPSATSQEISTTQSKKSSAGTIIGSVLGAFFWSRVYNLHSHFNNYFEKKKK